MKMLKKPAIAVLLLSNLAMPVTPAEATPLIGEVMMTGANFCPDGWLNADGSLLSIAQSDTLYSLLGTTYGGDGITTFALPNLNGRTAISQGQGPGLQNYVLGQAAGSETVTLLASNLPVHAHAALVKTVPAAGNTNDPTGNHFAMTVDPKFRTDANPGNNLKPANAATIASAGNNQPVNNIQPYLGIRWCVAEFGVYPSQN